MNLPATASGRISRWLLPLALLCTGCDDPGTGEALALVRGEVLEAGSIYAPVVPGKDAAWRPVELPDNWDGRRPGYAGYAWYRLAFVDDSTPGSRRVLYLPNAGMNAEIFFNRVRIGSQGRMEMPPTRHFYTPLLFELPEALFAGPGQENELLVLLAGYPGYRNGLGVAYVGPHEPLYGAWRWRGFWQNSGTLATSVFNIALGLYVLLLWHGERPGESHPALGWFGAAILVWGLRNLNLVLTEPPLPDLLWAQLSVGGAAAFTGLFSMFAVRLAEQEDPGYRAPPWLAKAVIAYIAIAVGWFVSAPTYQLANAGFVPLGIVAVSLTLWSVWHLVRLAWRRRTRNLVTVGAAATLYVILLFRDFGISADTTGLGPYFLRQYAALPLFVAIALMLARRYYDALERARELSASLQSQVQAQREELQRRFEQLREVERYQTLMEERNRLTRDLHDSLGMHLVSALRQVRGGDMPSPEALAGTLQDCLDDLRVVIDSLDTGERDPLVVLGTLRFRLAPRFEAMGVRLEWRIGNQDAEWPMLEPAITLELLRIVQEALTNALKHSGASVVTLSVATDARKLVVTVADNGCWREPDALVGRGLHNMRLRAERIGAAWSIAQAGGCTVRLALPVPAAASPAAPPRAASPGVALARALLEAKSGPGASH